MLIDEKFATLRLLSHPLPELFLIVLLMALLSLSNKMFQFKSYSNFKVNKGLAIKYNLGIRYTDNLHHHMKGNYRPSIVLLASSVRSS